MVWKIPSTAAQLYMGCLIASAGSATEPWLSLITIAHMGATIATLRGIDALIDMTFGRIVHNSGEAEKVKVEKKRIEDTQLMGRSVPPPPVPGGAQGDGGE